MAMQLVPNKAGGVEITDLLLAGGIKYFEERALTPYIGNGTLMSGAIKIVGSHFAKDYKPVSLALGIDGAEDIVQAIMSGGALGNLTGLLGGNQESSKDMVI